MGIVYLFGILSSLSGIFLLPIITKILGVEDYGLYVQFTITISLITGFATLGLPYTTVRFLSGEKNRIKIQGEVWSTIILIFLSSIIISLLFILFSENLGNALFGGLTILVIILAILIPIECVSGSLMNLLRVFQKIKHYTIFNIIKTYLELGIITTVILLGYGIIEVAISILFVRIIFLIVITIMMKYLVGFGKPNFSNMKKYLNFGLPTIPSNLAAWINDSSDRYIIAMYLGIAAVGYYNPGYTLGAMIMMLASPFDFVLVSITAEYYNKGRRDLVQDIFKRAIKYNLLLSIPSFIGLSILSKPILTILSTPEIANQSYIVTPFVGLSMVLSGLGATAIGKSFFLANKNHIAMINWILVAALNIVLCIILIPKMGILGAAIATLASFSFGFVFGTYFAIKYFDFAVDWSSITKIIFSSIIMGVVIFYLKPVTLIDLLLTILVGSIVYFALVFLTKTIDKNEIYFIKSFLEKK